MKQNKFVSIIIVNYNGKDLLEDCLGSIFEINYPKNLYEVIVVDNDSQDDSVDYIEKHFPKVKIIESDKNLGFAGGNNLAMYEAKGDYFAFINSDTKVDKNWLKYLVNTLQEKNVGVVSSKLRYHIPYIKLAIKSETHLKSNLYRDSDFSPLGLVVEEIRREKHSTCSGCWYLDGFHPPKGENLISRWTNGNGEILLPIEHDVEEYRLVFHGITSDFESKSKFEILIDDEIVNSGTIISNSVESISIKINKKEHEDKLIWLVQNAGNKILKNGLSRDIGSVIKKNHRELREFYDFDNEYYNKKRKIVGLCGASFIIKKSIVEKIGLFNDDFFMYYEDVDLGLRVWKSGWDIVYEPRSIVYHKHKASTNKEATIFFIKLIKKNHLLFLLLHFPLKQLVIKFVLSVSKTIVLYIILKVFEFFKYYNGRYKVVYIQTIGGIDSLKLFLNAFTRTYKNRKMLESTQKRSFSKLIKHLY